MDVKKNKRSPSTFPLRGPLFWLLMPLFQAMFFSPAICASMPEEVSHSAEYAITEEERAWLKEFFHDLLFEDCGAYVLYGTKPVSLSCIQPPLMDEEEAQLQAWLDSLPPEKKARMSSRERFDFYENFHKWEKIKHRFPIRQYLFGKFPSHKYEEDEFLLLINIETTLRTLLEYYDDFRRELGFEFDPFQVVFDVENKDSKFWTGVLSKSPVSLGILLGYGQDNAWFFAWQNKFLKTQGPKGDFIRFLPRQAYEELDNLHPNPQNPWLPIFVSYGLYPNDTALFEQYQRDRDKIRALYKGRDEVDVALEWLTR